MWSVGYLTQCIHFSYIGQCTGQYSLIDYVRYLECCCEWTCTEYRMAHNRTIKVIKVSYLNGLPWALHVSVFVYTWRVDASVHVSLSNDQVSVGIYRIDGIIECAIWVDELYPNAVQGASQICDSSSVNFMPSSLGHHQHWLQLSHASMCRQLHACVRHVILLHASAAVTFYPLALSSNFIGEEIYTAPPPPISQLNIGDKIHRYTLYYGKTNTWLTKHTKFFCHRNHCTFYHNHILIWACRHYEAYLI
jgi:hypothetical protein